MNAKELRAAAELAVEWDGYIHPEDKPAFDAWKLLADHILPTVRDDDDEPFGGEWAKGVVGDSFVPINSRFGLDVLGCRIEYEVNTRYERSYGCLDSHIKTRGEFRQLCRLLGIVLKELTHD